MISGSRSDLIKVLAIVAAVGATVFVLWWTGGWELFSNQEWLQRVVENSGLLAPVVFVLLLVAQAVLAPLPAPAVAAVGGYIFGTFEGFVLTWLGALLGGALCFGLSRMFGRAFVARSNRIKGLDRYVEEHGSVVVFVLRLVPLISFDAISYAAGLSGISFWRFLLATALGMAPGTFAFVYLGGASPGPGLYAVLGGLAVLTIGAYIYYRRNLRSGGS